MVVYANDNGLIPPANYCGIGTPDLILVSGTEEVCWGAAQNIFLIIKMSKRKCLSLFWILLCCMGHLNSLDHEGSQADYRME